QPITGAAHHTDHALPFPLPLASAIRYDAFEYGRRSETPHFDTDLGRAHTREMDVCHFIAVALTAAPLPAPRFFRRIQASTSPRPA
ncbi:hypothetical protein, partial [Mycobacterium sp.]|uniref:hypothetical protein n=1 Tax=Mycobacterium sp. TaxID=1785 RepID=UPI003C768F7A